MRSIQLAGDQIERRFTAGAGLRRQAVGIRSARAAGGAAALRGYGALFNVETVIGGYFRERISPGAFADSIAQDDIRIAYNHDANQILGRTSARTATVAEDSRGLVYEVEPPATTFGQDLLISVDRGDVTGSSFQFSIEGPDDEEWDYSQVKDGKLPLRIIKRASLYEVGPVAFPAYETTTVSVTTAKRVAAAGGVPLDVMLRELELEELEASVATTAPSRRANPRSYSAGADGILERELELLEFECGL